MEVDVGKACLPGSWKNKELDFFLPAGDRSRSSESPLPVPLLTYPSSLSSPRNCRPSGARLKRTLAAVIETHTL